MSLLTLDTVYNGLPYNDTAASDTLTLDVQHLGLPFLGWSDGSTPSTPVLNLTLFLGANF